MIINARVNRGRPTRGMDVLSNAAAPQILMGPAKPTVGIEESRAQRHQRQQNRFRDRGGIFKPSYRSTLLDILMGRRVASPKKSTRRSASCSPSKGDKNPVKVGAGNNTISTDAPRNDLATSPTKKLRSYQVPVLLKESGSTDSGKVQSSESGTNETSAACTKSKSVVKRRGWPTKQPKSVVTGDRQGHSGRSESKNKTPKTDASTRRRRTGSQESKTSTAKIIKPFSKLSSITEETGRSEVSCDKTSTATDSGEAKQKGKKKRDAAETVREAHTADSDEEETATLGETGTSRDSSKKKSNRLMPVVSSKPSDVGSTTPNRSCMNKPGKRRRVKSNALSGSIETNDDRSTTEPGNSVAVNQSSVKEPRPSKANTRRKLRPDSGNNKDGDENRGSGQKRVKFAGQTSKGTPQNGLGATKTLVPNYRDVVSFMEQIPNTTNVASHDDNNAKGSPSFISLEMSGAKSKKRRRNPDYSSSTSLKRVKLGNAKTKNSEIDKNTSDFPADYEGQTTKKADNVAVKKEVASKLRSVSKRPPKAGAQTKPKASSKRTKGLPRRVQQLISQSRRKQQSDLDDEPDPIDFLS